jgi:hypothetical protein
VAERVRNFEISDRAKLGIAGVLAVFVAAFLGALLALAIDGGDGDHHGPPEFGMVASGAPGFGESGAVRGVPGGGMPQQAVPVPPSGGGIPGGSAQGAIPVPPSGRGVPGYPDGDGFVQPTLPAVPGSHGNSGSGSSQGNGSSGSGGNGN